MAAAPHLESIPYVNVSRYQLISLVGVLGAALPCMPRCANSETFSLVPVADAIITITGGSMTSPLSLHPPSNVLRARAVIVVMSKSKTGGQSTDRLIHRISHITWISAAPPFVGALLNLAMCVGTWRDGFWYLEYVHVVFLDPSALDDTAAAST
jgi:hypothetical protein